MEKREIVKFSGRTAILVDGGFYRKRADIIFGKKKPEQRAKELTDYCMKHLTEKNYNHELYRIFYYDCPPIGKKVYHPLKKKSIDLSKSDTYTWTNDFFKALSGFRKVALRLGELAESSALFSLTDRALRRLLKQEIGVGDLTDRDFAFSGDQKGVDMRIGLDIASLAYKKQVDQIVLISGDSDFVAASKLARREGIDFVLDPMGANIKPALYLHIDGLRSVDRAIKNKTRQ